MREPSLRDGVTCLSHHEREKLMALHKPQNLMPLKKPGMEGAQIPGNETSMRCVARTRDAAKRGRPGFFGCINAEMKRRISVFVLAAVVAGSSPAPAANPPEGGFDSIEALIQILTEKGVLSREEAARFVERYRKSGGEVAGGDDVLVIEREKEISDRISENVSKDVKKQIQEELLIHEQNRQSMKSASDWAKKIRFGGDVRLRYQGDYFDKGNAPLVKTDKPNELMNTTTDRQRFRIRVRLAAKAKVNENVEAGLQLASGNESDPISTNDTLGDYMNKDSVVIDQAYLKYTLLPELAFTGGRIPNPWFFSDLVWDRDLNFEGGALSYKRDLTEKLGIFATAGVFTIQEVELSQRDKWLYAGQTGLEYSPVNGVKARVGVAYYDFDNIEGERNTAVGLTATDFTRPQFQQKGNTLMDIDPDVNEFSASTGYKGVKTALASDYNEINVTGQLDIALFYPTHVTLLADYVRNLGFDRKEVASRIFGGADVNSTDLKEEVEGYQVGLTVGRKAIEELGHWRMFLFYKYLESDAVLDAFTDSDFHLGGTNARGWILGGDMGLSKNAWLTGRWLTTDEIDGPPLSVDTIQVDLNVKY